jgi:SNF2-related domain
MRGGPLIGVESLALQGLPIDRLQLSHEKQSQLQDLAGNAMSSPVVGAAILAILIAGYPVLPPGQAGEDYPSNLHPPVREMNEDNLVPFDTNITACDPLSVAQVLDLAGKSFRLCLCEGRSFITKSRLQKCSSCRHTTCGNCGGNPCHEEYEPLDNGIIAQRILPSDFEEIIKRAIPMKMQVAGVTDEYLEKIFRQNIKDISRDSWGITINAVRMAFQSVLRFKSARRSEVWTIFYESAHARMELVIDSSKVQWLLFGKPLHTEPVNSRIRKLLSHPIARMKPEPHDITKGSWQLWLPCVYEIKASFVSHGELTPSFEDIMGLGRSLDTFVWNNCTISIPKQDAKRLDIDISGTYKLLQNCGTAEGSLYIKVDTETSSAPLFLFLDPDRVHDPKDDYFVFSTDKRRLAYDETRPVVARVEPGWRPQKFDKVDKEDAVGGMANIVKIFADGLWTDLHYARFKGTAGKQDELFCHARADLEILDNSDPRVQSPCQSHVAVLSCKATYPKSEYTQYMEDTWREIGTIEQKEFFMEFAWLMQRARVISGLDSWRIISNYTHIPCLLCAPAPPGIKWKLVTEQKRGNLTTRLVPFKNSKEAAKFEATLKKRVLPLITQVRIDSTGLAQLKIGFSPLALIHRAMAKLSSSLNTQLEVSWRLVTNDTTVAKLSLPKFEELKGNDSDSPARDPPGFKLKLRPEQLRSLGWMLKQEAAEVEPFLEEEVEECLIPSLGWRGEGRARRPVKVRGGLLADDVGFGKTATIIGLIDTQRERDAAAAEGPVQGRIRVKATLIMVPKHLCSQWRREIDKFIDASREYNVLVIWNLPFLQGCTIEQFQSADIIIASVKLCENEGYLLKIAEFAGVVELPKKSPWRATCTWYQDALNHMPRLIDELKNGGTRVPDMVKENLLASKEKAISAEFFAPSKRLRGQAYQDAKVNRVGSQKNRASEPTTSKRKRSPLAKDPQDTDSEDDTDAEDTDMQMSDVGKTKSKTTDFRQPSSRGKEPLTGSKRKRGNPRDTETEDSIDLDEIESQKSDTRKAKSKKTNVKNPDPFEIGLIARGKKSWVLMKCPLFELFEFSRLVVDEYTYVTGQVSLTLSNIKADSRWILSATPSLKDFADVKSIAGFLGINLGVDDFANGVVQAATVKRLLKDRTGKLSRIFLSYMLMCVVAEEFRSFKECHSAAWHKNRSSVAQRFVNHFVRKVSFGGKCTFTSANLSRMSPKPVT